MMIHLRLHIEFRIYIFFFLSSFLSFLLFILSFINDEFHRLLVLVESGIVKFMLGENLTDAEICPQNLGSNERRLRNGDLSMTYWIMSAGFCTAAVVFITEVTNQINLNVFMIRFTCLLTNCDSLIKFYSLKMILEWKITDLLHFDSIRFTGNIQILESSFEFRWFEIRSAKIFQ